MDREKVIKGLEELSGFLFKEYGKAQSEETSLYYDRFLTVDNAIALLKEQEARIEQLNRFVNGFSREAVPVVRCKDCKYYDYFNGCMSWHDVNSNNDNWYCADGERKE